MLRAARIFRDYHDAGSLNGLLAPWGFLDDHVFLTKRGHLGVAYRLTGTDFECLDQAQRRDIVHRFEAALRLLDESCRVYQYLLKRRIPPIPEPTCTNAVAQEALARRARSLNARRTALYELDLYLVLLYEGLSPRASSALALRELARHPVRALRRWLSTADVLTVLDEDVRGACRHLHHRAAAIEVQLADSVRPVRLSKSEAFAFLRRLLNYAPHKAEGVPLRYDTHLDYFVADSPIECQRRHLEVDDQCVKVLTMKEPPASTFPLILGDLYAVPGEWIACLEWRRLPNDKVRRDIHARRRHFFNRRVSLVNYVSSDTKPEEMLVDESAGATVRQLGDALTEIDVHGHFFGECSLSLVLHDQDPQMVERSTAEAIKVMATHDGVFVEETYNLLNAWLAVVPGNTAHNLRRLALLETNLADLSFLFTLDRGSPMCPHLQREALIVFETEHETPYHFALHVDDVGHTLVLGATGAGKSFLLNALITHAQRYEPFTVIFDLGHSYRKLATLFDASYLTLGLEHSDVQINPFALAPTPENLDFLHGFVRVLAEGADQYRITDAEDRELYEAIESLYVLTPEQRRLFTLHNLLPRGLAQRLSKWVDRGRYANLFDHAEDTLAIHQCQVFDFSAMRAFPHLLEPLLFYVLHRVTACVYDAAKTGVLKLCVMDEAWRFIKHERLRGYVEEALKTWRKQNAVMLLVSQAIEDYASSDLLRTVVEGCPTKLLLANPSLDRARYADLLRLNETELALLTDLIPRRQLLLKRPTLAKVLNLHVDPHSYWLYTNTPVDNERARAVLQQYGFSEGLDRLAASA